MSKNSAQTASSQTDVRRSGDRKSCQNCKYYTASKNRCNHPNWSWCVKRDGDGFVIEYIYHHFA